MFKQVFQQKVFRFRRFSNCKYAAFNSMHKIVSIGRVSKHISDKELLKAGKSVLVCGLMFVSQSGYADDGTPPESDAVSTALQIEEVSVVGQRSQFQSDIYRLVRNISSEEIAQLPVNSVAELLQYLPGVDMRERGASGVQVDVSMRGGTQEQVKVLLNGVDMTDPQSGHYTMDMPIDVGLIERIEVMQGTNYGLGAFSGAINIITKSRTDKPMLHDWGEVKGSVHVGEYGLIHPAMSGHFRKGEWQMNTGVSYNRSEGYISNTDYQIANVYVQTSWRELDFQIGAQMKDAGANNFYSLAYPHQADATRTAFATLSYQHRWGDWSLQGNIYHRTHYDRYELYRDGKDEEGNPAPDWYKENRHWTHSTGGRITGSWSQWWGKTSAGIDVRNEHISSSNLGVHNRVNINYFAEQTVYLSGFSGSVGASGIWNSIFGHDYVIGANMGYECMQGLHVFANVNRAIRIPTFTDLYYESATQLANPALRPEKALQLEAGIKYSGEHWFANASGYYRWGKDLIDWVKEPVDSIVQWKSMNHTDVDAMGCEVSGGVEGYEYLYKAELSYSFCHLNKDAGEWLSKYALDYLRHKISLRIEHRIWKGFGASWCLRWQQREGSYTDRMGEICQYKPVFLMDGQLYWSNEVVRIALECQNMTNQQYYDYGGILQPQHWAGMKVDWKL